MIELTSEINKSALNYITADPQKKLQKDPVAQRNGFYKIIKRYLTVTICFAEAGRSVARVTI